MPRAGKRTRKPGAGASNPRDSSERSGSNQFDQNVKDPLYIELDQRMRTLQLPAACSFIFGIIERYVRSLSSHEPIGASLPSKESLLSLVDTHVLKLPPVYHDRLKSKSRSSTSLWPFNVFEELELLDLLRVQIEDRPNLEVRLALFDALFGLIGRNSQVHVDHCMKVLGKLVSLSISMSCTVVLQCVATWMELYSLQSLDLSKQMYFEFCELLPNAMDPLFGMCTVCPALARLFTHHLTLHYKIYTATEKSISDVPHNCPPLPLLSLLSHWISTNPEYLFIQTVLVETRDDSFLLRSQKPSRALTPSPLKGLVQWCVMEPLLADECLRHVSSVDFKGDELVSKLRVEYSKLHADVLAGLLSFSSSASTVNLLSIDDVIGLVANVLDFSRAFCVKAECVEKSVERFAQLLQAGLSVGIIQPKIDGLSSIVSKLPQNRLMNLVLSRQRKPVSRK